MRKLAAIMFTDIVGYTALMGEDEPKALQLLQKNRELLKPIIKQFHGEWLKEIGDGSLSSFASAVDAVNCALRVQQILKADTELTLRIGIHIGDVVFEGGDVFGDGVNVASRIEPLAEPGGICISGRVYYDIKNHPNITVRPMGKRALKGVKESLETYAIVIDAAPSARRAFDRPGMDTSKAPSSEVETLVVPPFDDLSPGRANEHLADGMTEELITMLSKNKWLRVIARTSAMQYKGKALDIRQIRHELGAALALEGSIRVAGEKLRITAQLIDVSDGSHLWADRYDGNLDDIFSFQDEVAGKVTAAVKTELGVARREVLKTLPANTKAYEYYLHGKLVLHAPTVENLDRSVLMLERALKLDPQYADAYGVLAMAYLWNIDTGLRPDPKWLSEAQKAADKALELDNLQPDALFAMANLKLKSGLIEDGFDGLSEVLAIDPGYGVARMWRGVILYTSVYYEEALADANELLASDPFWPLAHWLYSMIQLHQGQFETAIATLEDAHAEVPSKLAWLSLAYRYTGNMDKAWEAARKLKEADPNGILWLCAFAFLYGAEGKVDDMLDCVSEGVKAFCWDFFLTVDWVASYYAMADQKDEAFKWLERSIAIGNRNYHWFAIDPNLENLRSDPRFDELMMKAKSKANMLRKQINRYFS